MHEESYYQRRLIPVNIVVIILCLVAALSILFAPILEIDIGKLFNAVQESEEQSTTDQSSSEEEEVRADAMNMITDALEGQKLTITTLNISKAAFSGDVTAVLSGAVANIMDGMTDKILVKVAIPAILEGMDHSLDEDVINNADVDKIYEKLEDLEKCSASGKDAAIDAFVDVVWEEMQLNGPDGPSKDDVKDVISDMYDMTAENNNGKFTVEACICITMSGALAEGEDEGGEGEEGDKEDETPIYTTYDELITHMMGMGSEEGGSAELDETMELISSVAAYFAYVMFGFAGVWLILFLFAFIHLFTKNKRFMMWYVKLLGCYPSIIFFLLPFVLKLVLTDPMIAGVLGAISSMMWISGICYLLLWAVSIFWAFPIKHKIRKVRKARRGA